MTQGQSLQKKSLAIFRAAYGEKHEALVRTMNQLSLTYGDRGELHEALGMAEQAAELLERNCDSDPEDVMSVLSNLASLHCKLGDLATAEALGTQTVELIRQQLGELHPAYATAGPGRNRRPQTASAATRAAAGIIRGYNGIERR
ncbi:MAG: tetratricopeptide repeat protein [Planctomycetota bacterium]